MRYSGIIAGSWYLSLTVRQSINTVSLTSYNVSLDSNHLLLSKITFRKL